MLFEPNVCQLVMGLRQLHEAIDPSNTGAAQQFAIQARAAILSGVDLLCDFSQWERTPDQISRIFHHLDRGSAGAAKQLLDEMIAKNAPLVPRFRIVIFNETNKWTNPGLVKAAGEIFGSYLYDENRKVHIASGRASYELTHLYSTSTHQLSKKMGNMLHDSSSGREDIIRNCTDVDKIDWRHKHFCGEPKTPNANNYKELRESEARYYQRDHAIEVPRPVDLQMVLSAADQQLLAGSDLACVDGLKTVVGMPEVAANRIAILAAITAFQARPDICRMRCALASISQVHHERYIQSEDDSVLAENESM